MLNKLERIKLHTVGSHEKIQHASSAAPPAKLASSAAPPAKHVQVNKIRSGGEIHRNGEKFRSLSWRASAASHSQPGEKHG